MADPIKKVWLDRATREALWEYAWDGRIHMGDVIRKAAVDVRDNPGNMDAMSETDGPSEVQVSVKAPEQLWVDAHAAAASVGMSLNSMIRRRIRKLLATEGYMG